MKMKGSGLVEYAVPLALFAVIIGLGIYSFGVNGNLLNMFLGSSNSQFDSGSKTLTINHKDKVAPLAVPIGGSFGTYHAGTSSSSSTCTDGNCSIDFGSFILTGVPENFGDYINKAGSSGGTEKLNSLLEQIVQILSQQGDIAGAAEYQKLANFGHIIADVQNLSENQAKACQNDVNPSTCLQNLINTQNIDVRYISGASNDIPDFYTKKLMSDIDAWDIGSAQNNRINYNDTFQSQLSTSPEYAMINTYEQIASNTKYSPELIGTTKEILRQFNTIQMEHNWMTLCVASNNGEGGLGTGTFDPITGAYLYRTGHDEITNAGTSDILNPNSSYFSNLNSALVCIASNNGDTNDTCHNK